jgi:hypothetical protein
VTLAAEELEFLARRSIEPVGEGSRFRWDRRGPDTEPVDPFAFLADVRCVARVMAGSESEVMPPASAERFATVWGKESRFRLAAWGRGRPVALTPRG